MARLDAWLWSVRVYKTRSAATAGVRGGHVRVDGRPAKPAQAVQVGQTISVRIQDRERIVKVVDPTLTKRVGASVAAKAYEDLTPELPPAIPQMQGRVAVRERGSGRPTKRERRQLDRLRGR